MSLNKQSSYIFEMSQTLSNLSQKPFGQTLSAKLSWSHYERLSRVENKEARNYSFNETVIKTPSVLEFLKIPTHCAYIEEEFEQALIDNLQQFLLELGKGFSFVARQKHTRTETDFTIAKYSVLSENKQLFANKYLLFLPTEEELVAEIEREKIIIKQQLGL